MPDSCQHTVIFSTISSSPSSSSSSSSSPPSSTFPPSCASAGPLSSLCVYTDVRFDPVPREDCVAVLGSESGLQVPNRVHKTHSKDAAYAVS